MPPVPDAVAPPAGNPRFPAIDGLRAVAAILVIVFHAMQFTQSGHTPIGRLFVHGDLGVGVFFLITGFLIYRPMIAAAMGESPPTPTITFYWRRILRIVPAYWLALAVLAPILTYAHPFGLANILFLQVYRGTWSRTGIAPGWSVCVEMSFYLLLPLYARILQSRWRHLDRRQRTRRELATLAVLGVGSLALRELIGVTGAPEVYTDLLPATLAWFCIGMSLAVLSVTQHTGWLTRVARRPGLCWLGALALYAVTASLTLKTAEDSVLIFAVYGLIAALMLLPLVLGGEWAGARLLRGRTLASLGLVSYGMYLYHFPLEREIHLHTGSTQADFVLLAALGVGIAVACGTLSYQLLERRVLALKNAVPFASLLAAKDLELDSSSPPSEVRM
jgi:peptidoglycan/LPS O-acetylase OafA/YrhL